MLIDVGLLKELWLEAINTVIYLFNQLSTQGLNKKVSIEVLNRLLFLKQNQDFCPNLSHLQVFSYTAYVHILKKKKSL